MTDGNVQVTTSGGVRTIVLNRPARLNALTLEMEAQYLSALREAGADPDVGAIVVTGAGRAFCAGADLDLLHDLDPSRAAAHRRHVGPVHVATTLDKPVIAAVHGVAAGMGMAHALLADLRVAASTATFVPAFGALGLVAEGGLAWLLPRLVGTSRALQVLWAHEPISSARALEIGMVDEVVPDDQVVRRAEQLAADLVERMSGYSLMQMKRQVMGGWTQSLDEALAQTDRLVLESLGRPEHGRSVDAARV